MKKKLTDIEYSKYSQNGEDGIIAYLLDRLIERDKTFVEIGCGNGKQNNTTSLAMRGYKGLVVDRKKARVEAYKERAQEHGWDVTALCHRITPELAVDLIPLMPKDPDVFSLDIDSVDYHVMHAMLKAKFRPKICVLEYNSTFGPDNAVTVPFPMPRGGHKHTYFGCSVMGWRNLMGRYGYRFVTVDSAGVNAIFIRGNLMTDYLDEVEWLDFADTKAFVPMHGEYSERASTITDAPLEGV